MSEFFKAVELDAAVVFRILLILFAAFLLERTIRILVVISYRRAKRLGTADQTRFKFFKNAIKFIVGIAAMVAIIYAIPSLKAMAITLFAGAGILVAIIGLAAQKAFANIISGVFIVLFKPFRVGDMIKVGSLQSGLVEDITLRHTVIQDFENRRIIIPNSIISDDTIVNSSITDMSTCEYIEMGISYDSEIPLARKIMQQEALAHPFHRDRRTQEDIANNEPVIPVRLVRFEDSSVILRANVWADDPIAARMMHFDLNERIKERFDQEGIEIPFPYRTIVYKNDLKHREPVENEA